MCYLAAFKKVTNNKKKYIGWRRWNVRNGKLKAVSKSGFYWGKANMTTPKNSMPAKENRCGFWLFKTKSRMVTANPGGYIYGKIRISGLIAHHRLGYRAEHAQILSLSDAKLAQKYGVKFCGDLKTVNTLRRQTGQPQLKVLPKPAPKPKRKTQKLKAQKLKARPQAIGKQPVEAVVATPTPVAVG